MGIATSPQAPASRRADRLAGLGEDRVLHEMGHVLGLSASLWNQFGLIPPPNIPADAYVRLAMIRLMLRRAPITDQKSKLLGWALRSNRLGASMAASPCPQSPEGGGLSTLVGPHLVVRVGC